MAASALPVHAVGRAPLERYTSLTVGAVTFRISRLSLVATALAGGAAFVAVMLA